MNKSTILVGYLLAVTTATSALARPTRCITSFALTCRSPEIIVAMIIRANKSYIATSDEGSLADGTYQSSRSAYRFVSGGLKDRSLVKRQGQFYLVGANSETRTSTPTKFDGALHCVRS
jgi:hypothetical protein